MNLLNILASVVTAMQTLIPLPREVQWGNDTFDFSIPYRIENSCPTLAQNIYLNDFTQMGEDGTSRMCIIRNETMPAESYRLHITRDTLLIVAHDKEGFIHAGQTLKQLAYNGELPGCDILDAPRFRWRGCMIDVSRHYFDLDCLKRQVDIMASLKLNRLHLHLTDAAGWRLQIDRYPLLTQVAAWRTRSDWTEWWTNKDRRFVDTRKETPADGTYGYFYTKDEMRELIAYANEHGITIIPEIEMPGHSEEVLAVYPELACLSDTSALSQSPDDAVIRGMNSGDLCPSNDKTFEFLCGVLDEVMELFPSQYIHIGGDEANMTAWKTCPRCQTRLQELGGDRVADLQADLISRINQYLNEHGHRLIGWDEIIASGQSSQPAKTAMVWREADHANRAIKNGYDVIMAPNSHCYLNRNQDAPTGSPSDWSYLPFDHVASFDPLAGLYDEQQGHVLGVQACLWTEHVTDGATVENRLYPRLLPLAEVGWRGRAEEDIRERATKFCDELISQGVNAFDLKHEVGERPESKVMWPHKAQYAQVTYLRNYNRYYQAEGVITLTDGLRGGWRHGDGRWQGFIGDSCLHVIIDLGQRTDIHRVSMDFMQNAGPDIYLPALWVIECSDDGKNWRELYRQTSTKITRRGLMFDTWRWQGNARTRYLRILASSHDRRSWIFTDEIIVE
ncbi:MAG: family 20 glycosylhydrolase [Muribaculaceae bacterium]|nr:family 20 glycosylhydrolase [Muribaculaceae bacterium]